MKPAQLEAGDRVVIVGPDTRGLPTFRGAEAIVTCVYAGNAGQQTVQVYASLEWGAHADEYVAGYALYPPESLQPLVDHDPAATRPIPGSSPAKEQLLHSVALLTRLADQIAVTDSIDEPLRSFEPVEVVAALRTVLAVLR